MCFLANIGRTDSSLGANHLKSSEPSKIIPTPLYRQRKQILFIPKELVTHECWCENGEYLTFVDRRNKIKKVYVNTNESEVIMNDGPNSWHCDGSK